ncbi:peptidase S24 [Elizabethkingia anophelis]|uniref:S24 family peptidase n=1 Tax=Elizabethkingia anophelis TaxID=1117645 RepID=UPI00136E9BD8|nr:S24 family peptidase [Elizabethkingia anophelis]MYZ60781.1 peptidase S24 [Elizabethkingia anophelis]
MDKQQKLKRIVSFLKGQELIKTQKELAERIDFDKTNLSSAINGNISYLTDGLFEKIAAVFPQVESLFDNETNIENEKTDYKRPKGKSSIAIHDIQTLPLYDSTATLGLVEIFNNTENGNVIDHISIPNLPKSDGAIFMTGDSMYPLLKSGDIIALKIINPADIIYGEMYYVEYYGSDESSVFKVVKYVKKSDLDKEHIKLVSYNTHHDPTDILKNRIKTIAIVNASIRYNRLG